MFGWKRSRCVLGLVSLVALSMPVRTAGQRNVPVVALFIRPAGAESPGADKALADSVKDLAKAIGEAHREMTGYDALFRLVENEADAAIALTVLARGSARRDYWLKVRVNAGSFTADMVCHAEHGYREAAGEVVKALGTWVKVNQAIVRTPAARTVEREQHEGRRICETTDQRGLVPGCDARPARVPQSSRRSSSVGAVSRGFQPRRSTTTVATRRPNWMASSQLFR
jgi:hypothetical protein